MRPSAKGQDIDDADRAFSRFAQHGDPADVAQVFDVTAPRLILVASHLVRDAADAEDLLQTTFLEAIQHAKDFEPGRAVLPWLLAIMTRRASNRRRDRARRRAVSGGGEEAVDSTPGPREMLEHREMLDRVSVALAGLSSPYREVLVLRFVHGLRPIEIAHALDRPAGSVHSQLHRGLTMLRGTLPKGILATITLLAVGGPVLAGVRNKVVAAAKVASGVSVALTLGGIMTLKKVLLVACALILVIFAGVEVFSSPSVDGPVASAPNSERTARHVKEQQAAQSVARAEANRSELATPTQQAGASSPKLIIRVTRSDTTGPVIGSTLRLLRWDGHQPEMQQVRTDNAGIATVDGIARGEVRVHPGGARIIIAPTGTTHYELVLTPLFTLRGIVMDPDRRPLAGASVYSTDTANSERTAVLEAKTGADGRFAWTSWSPYDNVYATARGFAASPVFDLYGSAAEPPGELRIVLSPAKGAVTGIVVDAEGHPIVGASLALSPPAQKPVDPKFEKGFFRSSGRRCPRRVTQTDSSGRFHFADVPAGRAYLRARCEGHGQHRGVVDVASGPPTPMQVDLGPAMIVRGRAADQDGHALAGVVVAVGSLEEFGRVSGRSAADGTFVLEGVPTFIEEASIPVEAFKLGYDTIRETLRARSDVHQVRFDPVLRRIPLLAALLLDTNDEPLVGWLVEDSGGGHLVDKDGRFSVRWEESGAPVLSARSPMGASPQVRFHPPQPLVCDPEKPGRRRVYRPDPERCPTGFVSGRVLLPDMSPHSQVRVIIRSEPPRRRVSHRVDPTTGEFRIGPIAPGSYALEVGGDELPRHDLGLHELHAHQSLELGEIPVHPRVPLRVDVRMASGGAVPWMRTSLRGDKGHRWGVGLAGGVFGIEPLPAGGFELCLFGPTVRWQRIQFELEAGRAKSLQITLHSGHPVRFRARVPKGVPQPDRVRIDIRDAAGSLIAELDVSGHILTRSYEACGFAPGEYSVKATMGTLTGSAVLVVPRTDTKPVEVVLRFR